MKNAKYGAALLLFGVALFMLTVVPARAECVDPDGGNPPAQFAAHTCNSPVNGVFNDVCTDPSHVREYYCDRTDDTCDSKIYECINNTCKDGRCLPSVTPVCGTCGDGKCNCKETYKTCPKDCKRPFFPSLDFFREILQNWGILKP